MRRRISRGGSLREPVMRRLVVTVLMDARRTPRRVRRKPVGV